VKGIPAIFSTLGLPGSLSSPCFPARFSRMDSVIDRQRVVQGLQPSRRLGFSPSRISFYVSLPFRAHVGSPRSACRTFSPGSHASIRPCLAPLKWEVCGNLRFPPNLRFAGLLCLIFPPTCNLSQILFLLFSRRYFSFIPHFPDGIFSMFDDSLGWIRRHASRPLPASLPS